MNTTKFNTREEAIQELIIEPITDEGAADDARDHRCGFVAGGDPYAERADVRTEYDVEAIADVLITRDDQGRWSAAVCDMCRAGKDWHDECPLWDEFWGIVGDNVRWGGGGGLSGTAPVGDDEEN